MGSVPHATANGIELEYDTFGSRNGAPLLLIAGLGSQSISWDDDFCVMLMSRGFQVIRFDNRDIGLSTKFDQAGPADIGAAVAGNPQPAYTLDDMAADAVGLLDTLKIPAAHVVGASMGGFIAQLVALDHPRRVLSLTSIFSGPNGHDQVAPTDEGTAVLLMPAQATREARIEQGVFVRKTLRGHLDPFNEEREYERAARMVDRSYHPAGYSRQFVAILAAPSRVERLRSLRIPTLVIHGTDDVLIPLENGRIVAAAVPGARLVEIDGMGHVLPERVWPQVADEIARLAREAVETC